MNERLNPRYDHQASSVLVSIIIACRNESAHIKTCLRSVLSQQCKAGHIEVLVVDGMSDDGTRAVLESYGQHDSRVRVIDNLSRTTPCAFNLGIQCARGEYIAILGAHSEYASNYVDECLNVLVAHPEVCSAGGPIISRGNSLFGQAVAIAMSHPLGVGNAKHRFPNYEGYADAICFPVFRKEIFEKVGLFDEQLVRNQDDDFYFRVTQIGEKFFLSPRARCTYFVRESLGRLFKQYYQYGFWRTAVIRKHGRPASIRQLAPATFILLVLIGLIAGLLLPGQWGLLAMALPIIYGSTLLAAAIGLMRGHGPVVGLLFPFAAATMHFAYGTGFLLGIVEKKKFSSALSI